MPRKWAITALGAAFAALVVYVSVQSLCDVNMVDIATSPATSRKLCTFPLPRIPFPECQKCEEWYNRSQAWKERVFSR
jgi:hypothetical protein